jgi:polyhydroxybutyrate depolymerase
VDRNYVLYVPDAAVTAMQNKTAVPVLVALHGAGDKASNFILGTALKPLATQNAFVLIAPNAYPGNGGAQGWALSSQQGWPAADGNMNSAPNDIGLVMTSLKDTAKEYLLDTKRYFVTGFSRGAGFASILALASKNPDAFMGSYASPFAAYAISAGYDMFGGQVSAAKTDPKRPFWLIHGTNDAAVPFASGQSFADSLTGAAWPGVIFTPIQDAPHNWLWQAQFGHSNQELWDWFMQNALP